MSGKLLICAAVIWTYAWYMHGLDVAMEQQLEQQHSGDWFSQLADAKEYMR